MVPRATSLLNSETVLGNRPFNGLGTDVVEAVPADFECVTLADDDLFAAEFDRVAAMRSAS